MDKAMIGRITGIGLVALVLVGLGVGKWHATPNGGFGDATAALAFISAAAVGIERLIEWIWTMVGATKGTFWPLTTVDTQVGLLVDDLNSAMKSFHDAAKERLQLTADSLAGVKKAFERINAEKADLDRSVATVTKRLGELTAGAKDTQRLQLLAATASQNVSYLSALYGDTIPELQRAGRAADAAINGLQDFVATFKDNPGRRLVSLYLGVLIGLLVAGGLGLDLVTASLDKTPSADGVVTAFYIIATGVVIGLGSNPTHEVIRAIQEYKKGRKGENVLTPDQPTSPIPTTLLTSNAPPFRSQPIDTSTLATSQRIARMVRRLPEQPAQR